MKDLFGERDISRQQRFFAREENGRHIFLPWGHGGEGYYVNGRQKKNIAIFTQAFLGGVIVVLSVCALSVGFALQRFLEFYWLLVFFTTLLLLLYVAGVWLVVRILIPNPEVAEPDNKKPSKMTRELMQLTCGLLILFVISYFFVPNKTYTIISGLFSAIFYPSISMIAFFKKGYIFQKPLPSVKGD